MRAVSTLGLAAAATVAAVGQGGCIQRVEVLRSRPVPDMDAAEMPAPAEMGPAIDMGREMGPADMRPVVEAPPLSLGTAHGCRLERGELWCWGANADGQLGLGDEQDRQAPTLVDDSATWLQVAAGRSHTCALDGGHIVWCWGANVDGQLGPLGPDQGLQLRPVNVPLPGEAMFIAVGWAGSCAILEDRSLWCWGSNAEGQLARGFAVERSAQPTPIEAGATGWVAVELGEAHTCGVRADGTLWCWGRNERGELGQGSNLPQQIREPTRVGRERDWSRIAAGRNHTCGVRADGTLWCWGANFAGQLGVQAGDVFSPRQVAPAQRFEQLAMHTFSTCALSVSGQLWCWGRNVEGQLGLGDNQNRSAPTRLEAPGGAKASCVRAGRSFVCACADGGVWCAGANDGGQLGLGDRTRRNVLTRQPLE